MIKKALTFLSVLTLAACGFTPIYDTQSPARAALSRVEIAPISDRLGQQMRGYMLDRMGASASGDHRLDITLSREARGFGIRPDAAATQTEVVLIASVTLTDLASGDVVLTRDLRARTAFDVVLSDYATLAGREDAEKRLAFDLADRLQLLIAGHFNQQGS